MRQQQPVSTEDAGGRADARMAKSADAADLKSAYRTAILLYFIENK